MTFGAARGYGCQVGLSWAKWLMGSRLPFGKALEAVELLEGPARASSLGGSADRERDADG